MVDICSYNGPAILSGLRNAGKLGKVKVVAFDEERDTIAGVQNGTVHAAVAQDPYQFGYQRVLLLPTGISAACPPARCATCRPVPSRGPLSPPTSLNRSGY